MMYWRSAGSAPPATLSRGVSPSESQTKTVSAATERRTSSVNSENFGENFGVLLDGFGSLRMALPRQEGLQ